jgi:hypothetical protein
MARRPWEFTEQRLPRDASPDAKLRAAIDYAVLAPSGHNTQPWQFRIVDEALELWADRTRALPIVDPHDRELTISCGAALAFVRIALRQSGHDAITEALPEPSERDLLARIWLGTSRQADDRDRALFAAIPRRRTVREPFEDRELDPEFVQGLEQLAEREGAWLARVELHRRGEVAALVSEGDRVQAADPHFRRELAAWFRPNNTASRDGIPGYAFGMGDLFSRVGALVLNHLNWGKYQARKDLVLLEHTPLLAVLGTDSDSARDWLAAGQALGFVLLRARAEGVSASYLNQPIEVAELRPRLAGAIDRAAGFPQLLLRLGHAGDRTPTPRREPADVISPYQ